MGARAVSRALLTFAFVLALPLSAFAQRLPIGDPLEEYLRVLQLTGEIDADGFNLRPVVVPPLDRLGEHPWKGHVSTYGPDSSRFDFRFVSPASTIGWMSSRPAGQNDGFLWQGRGLSTTLHTGIFLKYSFISAALRPALAFVQNADFNVGPGSPYHYYGRSNIDNPRRFGPDPFVRIHPGESYVELSAFGAAIGAASSNMWWGPGTENAIIMSNNAPGFGHVYVKTARPLALGGVFDFDAKWFWGNVYESEYFDSTAENDRRFITGLGVELQPYFIPNLYVGATRVFVQATDEEPTRTQDFFIVFQNPFKAQVSDSQDPFGFDKNDQLASFFARWIFPESGFDVYAEIAQGDHRWDLRHAFVQLNYGTGYTLGMSKVFQIDESRLLSLNAELTRLEAAKTDITQSGTSSSNTYFYANEIVRQGYTHEGQVMGASIGPGSNSQYLGADWYEGWGKVGWHIARVVHDNDLLYGLSGDPAAHQVEFISGLNGVAFRDPFEFTAAFSLRRFLNLHYERNNDEWNVTARIGVRWNVGRYR